MEKLSENNLSKKGFNDLPAEMVESVLLKLDLPVLIRMRLVCKSWLNLIDHLKFKELNIIDHDRHKIRSWFYTCERYNNQLMLPLRHLIIDYLSKMFNSSLFKQLYQKLLKLNLDFRFINEDEGCFISMLNNFECLEQLNIHQIDIKSKQRLCLPNLKNLSIHILKTDIDLFEIEAINLKNLYCSLNLDKIKFLNPETLNLLQYESCFNTDISIFKNLKILYSKLSIKMTEDDLIFIINKIIKLTKLNQIHFYYTGSLYFTKNPFSKTKVDEKLRLQLGRAFFVALKYFVNVYNLNNPIISYEGVEYSNIDFDNENSIGYAILGPILKNEEKILFKDKIHNVIDNPIFLMRLDLNDLNYFKNFIDYQDDFKRKFKNIQKLVITKYVKNSILINILKSTKITTLEILKSDLNKKNYYKLPILCPNLMNLTIFHSRNINLKFKFIFNFPYLHDFETNQILFKYLNRNNFLENLIKNNNFLTMIRLIDETRQILIHRVFKDFCVLYRNKKYNYLNLEKLVKEIDKQYVQKNIKPTKRRYARLRLLCKALYVDR